MNRPSCRGCIYHRRLWDHGTPVPKICHYLLDTGKVRPCPASACTCKQTKRQAEKKRTPTWTFGKSGQKRKERDLKGSFAGAP